MHLPAFLLPVFVCLPAAVCLSVCLVFTFNFLASLPILWQPACLMTACLSYDSLPVLWQPACLMAACRLMTACLSHGSLAPTCLMTACLSYDSLPVLWQPACIMTACMSLRCMPFLHSLLVSIFQLLFASIYAWCQLASWLFSACLSADSFTIFRTRIGAGDGTSQFQI